MLEFLKNYYVFMLVLMVFSYLVPREDYKAYMQFFISVFIIVLLLKPVLELFMIEDFDKLYEMFETFSTQIESLDVEMEEGEDIFEHFFSER